jgi:hypothetical protein
VDIAVACVYWQPNLTKIHNMELWIRAHLLDERMYGAQLELRNSLMIGG